VVDAVMGGEGRHLALVDVHSLRVVVGRRSQVRVEVVDRAVASSAVVVDVDPVLGGAGVALLHGAEASDQGL